MIHATKRSLSFGSLRAAERFRDQLLLLAKHPISEIKISKVDSGDFLIEWVESPALKR